MEGLEWEGEMEICGRGGEEEEGGWRCGVEEEWRCRGGLGGCSPNREVVGCDEERGGVREELCSNDGVLG